MNTMFSTHLPFSPNPCAQISNIAFIRHHIPLQHVVGGIRCPSNSYFTKPPLYASPGPVHPCLCRTFRWTAPITCCASAVAARHFPSSSLLAHAASHATSSTSHAASSSAARHHHTLLDIAAQSQPVLLAIVTGIILLSIMFEHLKEKLSENSGSKLGPAVQSAFSELTVLGFITLVIFITYRLGFITTISMKIFNDYEELHELIEDVHMVVFFAMMLFLGLVVLLISMGKKQQKMWTRFESALLGAQKKAIRKLAQRRSQMRANHIAFRLRRGTKVNAQELEKFAALRQAFIENKRTGASPLFRFQRKEHHASELTKAVILQGPLNSNFRFADYLSAVLSNVFVEIINIQGRTWAVMWVIFLLTSWLIKIGGLGAAFPIYVTYKLMMVAALIFMDRHLDQIEEALTPCIASSDCSSNNSTISESPCLLDSESYMSPPYLSIDPQSSPAQLHERLFFLGSRGPTFIMNLLQGCLLFTALSFSSLVVLFVAPSRTETSAVTTVISEVLKRSFGGHITVPMIIVFGFILSAFVMVLVAKAASRLVLTASVEGMKHAEVARKVTSEARTRRVVALLAAAGSLQHKNHANHQSTTQTPKEFVDQIFASCDLNDDGRLDIMEIIKVLGIGSPSFNSNDALMIESVAGLDTNRDGTVSRDEFEEYVEAHWKLLIDEE